MAKNLERMGTLPNSCKIFCGHEYTLNNFKFAAAVEPDNAVVMERINAARRLRRDRFPTMPTTSCISVSLKQLRVLFTYSTISSSVCRLA